jgi:hypothetical protein
LGWWSDSSHLPSKHKVLTSNPRTTKTKTTDRPNNKQKTIPPQIQMYHDLAILLNIAQKLSASGNMCKNAHNQLTQSSILNDHQQENTKISCEVTTQRKFNWRKQAVVA